MSIGRDKDDEDNDNNQAPSKPQYIDGDADVETPNESAAPNYVEDGAQDTPAPAKSAYAYQTEDTGETAVRANPEAAAPAQPGADKTPAALAKLGFKLEKELRGGGVSGDVALYAYHGNDPAIQSLLHDGILLIKTPRVSTTDESKLTNDERHAIGTARNEVNLINSHLSAAENPAERRPKMMALTIDGQTFILNECIYANDKKDVKDLEYHVVQQSACDSFKPAHAVVQPRVEEFHGIFKDIYLAVREIHNAGLLHLDIAPRNFVMSAGKGCMVIDFGGSVVMNEDGKAVDNPEIRKLPIYLFDRAAALSRNDPNFQLSINTDLIAVKFAMMETLARYAGVSVDRVFLDRGTASERATITGMSDEDRLQRTLNNLEQLVSKVSDSRKLVVQQIIQEYGHYLTSVPKGATREEIERNDSLAFPDKSVVLEAAKAPDKPVGPETASTADIFKSMQITSQVISAQTKQSELTAKTKPAVSQTAKTAVILDKEGNAPLVKQQGENEPVNTRRGLK